MLEVGKRAKVNYVREFKAGAHASAFMQHTHCVYDTLAHVIWLALGTRIAMLAKLQEHRVTIESVQRCLAKDPAAASIAGKVTAIINHADYRHLSDAVNHSKHRRIVGLKTLIRTDEGPEANPYLLLERSHTKRSTTPSVLIQEFLQAEYSRQSHLVVDIGRALNAALSQ